MTASKMLGRLVGSIPGGAARPAQERMAELCAAALTHPDRPVVVQAGTGAGKSFAYLAAAVMAARTGKRVVVSTGTKALQRQLEDDVRVAARATGCTAAVLKGLSNYVCAKKLDEATGTLLDEPEAARVADAAGEPGVRGEAALIPGGDQWTVTSDECPGRTDCPKGDECWTMQARDRAREADVVVVNHSLLAVDHSIARRGGQGLLGNYGGLVVDECHLAEAAILDTLETRLTPGQIHHLARAAKKEIGDRMFDPGRNAAQDLDALLRRMLQGEPGEVKEIEPGDDWLADEQGEPALEFALDVMAKTAVAAQEDPGGPEARLNRLAKKRVDDMVLLSPASEAGLAVQYLQIAGQQPAMIRRPIMLGPAEAAIWDTPHVLCSATVPDGIAKRLRLPSTSSGHDVGSPLDYRSSACLYSAPFVPAKDQDTGEWLPRPDAWSEMLDLMEAAGGRALVLFPSVRSLRAARGWMRPLTRLKLLAQGEDSTESLLAEFGAEEDACLFGVRTCFEGVDIPGRSLSLVIVERVPNLPPHDPVVRALARRGVSYDAQNADHARMLLRQGWGRLLRRETDRGVLAIFDDRAKSRPHIRAAAEALDVGFADREEALRTLREIAAEPQGRPAPAAVTGDSDPF